MFPILQTFLQRKSIPAHSLRFLLGTSAPIHLGSTSKCSSRFSALPLSVRWICRLLYSGAATCHYLTAITCRPICSMASRMLREVPCPVTSGSSAYWHGGLGSRLSCKITYTFCLLCESLVKVRRHNPSVDDLTNFLCWGYGVTILGVPTFYRKSWTVISSSLGVKSPTGTLFSRACVGIPICLSRSATFGRNPSLI